LRQCLFDVSVKLFMCRLHGPMHGVIVSILAHFHPSLCIRLMKSCIFFMAATT